MTTKQFISTVYIFFSDDTMPVDITIARHGRFGYSEHVYKDVSSPSLNRVLGFTPPKPSKIARYMLTYRIRH